MFVSIAPNLGIYNALCAFVLSCMTITRRWYLGQQDSKIIVNLYMHLLKCKQWELWLMSKIFCVCKTRQLKSTVSKMEWVQTSQYRCCTKWLNYICDKCMGWPHIGTSHCAKRWQHVSSTSSKWWQNFSWKEFKVFDFLPADIWLNTPSSVSSSKQMTADTNSQTKNFC